MQVSVIIPAKNEKYLDNTIQEVLTKGDSVEVVVILDNYEPPTRIDGVKYISMTEIGPNVRRGVSRAVHESTCPFVMKLDAHCMLDKGFDTKLIATHESNIVQVPRRYRLDAEKWHIIEDGRPAVDYEYILFPNLLTSGGLSSMGFIWGSSWEEYAVERKDVLLDDTPHFQGSAWFMSKEWFLECGFLNDKYGGFAQEPEEILFTTVQRGGSVKVNKHTWYAHLHKNKEDRKWFVMPPEDLAKGYEHAYNTWVEDRDFFANFIERFPPMPHWPSNWKNILWE